MTPERRNELALRAVSVLVVGSIAWALAALTWRLVGWDDGRSVVAVAESLPPLGVQAGGQDPDVARIVSLAPFGGGAAAVGGLPASTLGLVLKGVLAAYPPSASTALIAVGEGPVTIYGVGQSPVGNAVIEAIEIDHVILNVGGTRERLDFPQPVVAPVDPAAAAPGAGITVTPVAPGGTAPPPPPPAGVSPPLNPGAGAVTPAPPPAQTAAATAATVGVSATASGYRVGPNPSAELRRFGLQPGDVIESLNGQAVSGSSNDQQLYDQARAAGQARVVVNRDGRRLTLNFPVR